MTIKVALLGATGMLGRECSSYLFDYADIEVVYYVGSASTQGKPFYDIWKNKEFILKSHYGSIWKELEVDPRIKDVTIIGFDDLLTKKDEVDVVFSFLAPRFGNLDEQLIQEGFTVLSNSPYKRLDTNVPLCIPEVNKYVLENRVATKYVKSPGCCTIGISLGIVPIVQKYGLQEINITTFQSLSGRGDHFTITKQLLATYIQLDKQPKIKTHTSKTKSENYSICQNCQYLYRLIVYTYKEITV